MGAAVNIYSQINPNLDIIDSNSYNNKQKIFSDEIVRGFFSKNADNKSAIVKHICKEYATEAIEVLAAMQGVTPEEYEGNPFTIMMQVFEIMNDPDLLSVFTLSEQKTENKSSGSATENTEETISELSLDTTKADT